MVKLYANCVLNLVLQGHPKKIKFKSILIYSRVVKTKLTSTKHSVCTQNRKDSLPVAFSSTGICLLIAILLLPPFLTIFEKLPIAAGDFI